MTNEYGRTIKIVKIEGVSLILSLHNRTFFTRRENSQFVELVGTVASFDGESPTGETFRAAYSYFRKDANEFSRKS